MRGATCPGPIVEAKKLLNGMGKGSFQKFPSLMLTGCMTNGNARRHSSATYKHHVQSGSRADVHKKPRSPLISALAVAWHTASRPRLTSVKMEVT